MSSADFRSVGFGIRLLEVRRLARLSTYNYEAERPQAQFTTDVISESLLEIFMRNHRSLLFDADVEQEGTNRITTTSGAHLTSDAVIDALKMRAERRASRSQGTVARREKSDDRNDPPAQIRRLFFRFARNALAGVLAAMRPVTSGGWLLPNEHERCQYRPLI